MDDTAQKPNQAVPQVAPVGTANKEIGVAPVSDFVRPSEPEPIKDQEVVDAGVQKIEQEIKVEEEHKRMGVKIEPAPVKTEPTGVIPPLMTPAEIAQSNQKGVVRFNSIGEFFSGINFAASRNFLAALLIKIQQKLTGQPA
jgi:hypothetical protein